MRVWDHTTHVAHLDRGRSLVLVRRLSSSPRDGDAVWAVVRQRTPSKVGTGASRGRKGVPDVAPRYVWRNMVFRNLGRGLSSDLIRSALKTTYLEWFKRYGELPPERLRTEIGIREVRSVNPGYCYKKAGWWKDRVVRGKLYLWAPCPTNVFSGSCDCCPIRSDGQRLGRFAGEEGNK